MAANGEQAATPAPAGFWKVRHAVIGIAVLGLLTLVVVKSCGGDAEDDSLRSNNEREVPRQGIAVQRPEPGWSGQYVPAQPQRPYGGAQQPGYGYAPQQQQSWGGAQQPGYAMPQQQPPAYGAGQQPAYGYQQQQPAYGGAQQPAYGYQQQQPAYGGAQQPAYGYQQQQPAYTTTDPDNPWATQQQRPYGYSAQMAPAVQQPQWGQPQPRPPVYTQLPGASQYRPLDETTRAAEPARAPANVPAPAWPAAPYDRLGGSSFGNTNNSGYPGVGGYPGYYGGAPYGAPGMWPGRFGTGWPGGMGFPGIAWPMGW